MFISKEWKNEKVFTINNKTVSHKNVIKVTVLNLITTHALINEACIGVLGIQDICHFTSRDIGYYQFYFQGYGIFFDFSLTVKAVPHECLIRTGQP